MDKRSKYLRKLIIRQLVSQGRGHIGSAMSLVEILRVLYDEILRFNPRKPHWEGRDRLILSKGHGCLALYAILADKGFFPLKTLDTFCNPASILGGHPEAHIVGVEWATGSLGHGLPVGVGITIILNQESGIPGLAEAKPRAGKNQGNISKNHDSCFMLHDSGPHVFVILGDGESDEGSVWEAALIAGKHKLSNLTVIVDYNKIQSYGKIPDVQPLEPFRKKWEAFGFAVRECDGHDLKDLKKVFSSIPFEPDKPNCIIAHTIKGKGIGFIENKPEWHHKRGLTDTDIQELFEGIEKYKD